jgi:hypothetical protein
VRRRVAPPGRSRAAGSGASFEGRKDRLLCDKRSCKDGRRLHQAGAGERTAEVPAAAQEEARWLVV